MVCIHCGSKTQVVNSRLQRRSNQVWRRRQCTNCAAVFTTQEAPHYETTWLVNRQGQFQPFLTEKLVFSLHRSLQHRPTALQDAVDLSRTIINKLGAQARDGLLEAAAIAQVAQIALNRFDKAASASYAAYHPTR